MNRSAELIYYVNRKADLKWFVCFALWLFPYEPRKKTFIPYIYNDSNEDSKALAFTLNRIFLFSFLPGGHLAGLDGFVGCIDLTYLRDSLTNIRIRVLSPGRPSLGRMPHSPYYFFFRVGVHISLFCPPSTCVCMCAVNAGGCVFDLFVQGWASTSSLLCLVTGNSANTDNSPVPTSPFCIPPYQAWRVAGGRWKITSDTLTLFRRTAPTGNRTRVASVIGQSVNH